MDDTLRRPPGQPGSAAGEDSDGVALVARARDGDRVAFELLVRGHIARLYAILTQLGVPTTRAEAILLRTMVSTWNTIARCQDAPQLASRLYAIAIAEAERHLTRDDASSSCPTSPTQPGDRAAPQRVGATRIGVMATLEGAVLALPIDHRVALVLRDVEGLSPAQAAAAMAIDEAPFRTRLHRARLAVYAAIRDSLDSTSL